MWCPCQNNVTESPVSSFKSIDFPPVSTDTISPLQLPWESTTVKHSPGGFIHWFGHRHPFFYAVDSTSFSSFGFLGAKRDLNKAYILLPMEVSKLGTRLSVSTLSTSKNISSHSTKKFPIHASVNSSIRPKHDGCSSILG